MKAGIDCGTTNTKAVWRTTSGEWRLRSTADSPISSILREMRKDGVDEARTTGVGKRPNARGIALSEPDDLIADEIALQVSGVRHFLSKTQGPGTFLLAAVGTGTSYTLVHGDTVRRFPFGSAIAGGFIDGLAAALRFDDVSLGEAFASVEEPLDMLVRDVVPAAAGTLAGEFVVAHFGKVRGTDMLRPGQVLASAVRCVAVSLIRDVMVMGMIDGYAADDVVFIGTTVARFRSLRDAIGRYAAALGKRTHFPANGEYAAAFGAYLAAAGE
jgi:pantothenate kinase